MLQRSVFGLMLAAAIALATPTQTAQATSLAELSEEQMTDAATYIVQGTVTDVWTEVDDMGRVWTRARVDVDVTYKGPDTPGSLVVDTLGGQHGERVFVVPASSRWSEGEDVFLYLDTVDFGRRLTPVSMFRGKLTIRRAPGETRNHVMRVTLPVDETYDHNFLPHPAAADRFYLDTLVERVQTRLDTGWDGEAIPGISPEKLEKINTLERRLR